MARQTRSTMESSVNGVDVDRLKSTVEAMKAVPGLAKFTFRVNNRWMKGALNRTTIGDFHGAGAENHRDGFVIDNAQPVLVAGGDEAPNPVEYLLHALVGCLTTTLVYHASTQGVRIQAVESQVEGLLDMRSFLGVREDLPGGFEGVNVRFQVKADCSAAELAHLMDVARRRSPVANFVLRAVPTSVTCEAM
jgi:uncharacterized OsmC-like protein